MNLRRLSNRIFIACFVLTLVSGVLLCAPRSSAANTATFLFQVTVPEACSISSGETHLDSTTPSITSTIGTSNITAFCNDACGFAIYAVGSTGNTIGDTNLRSTSSAAYIPTGSASPATGSQWNFAIGQGNAPGNYAVTIVDGYNSAHTVPSTYTKIAYRNSVTDQTIGANFTATYYIYASSGQAPETYSGDISYFLIHPHIISSNPVTYSPATLHSI